jgi:hypothetical protein
MEKGKDRQIPTNRKSVTSYTLFLIMTQQELRGGWVRAGSGGRGYARRGVVLNDLCEVVGWHDSLGLEERWRFY